MSSITALTRTPQCKTHLLFILTCDWFPVFNRQHSAEKKSSQSKESTGYPVVPDLWSSRCVGIRLCPRDSKKFWGTAETWLRPASTFIMCRITVSCNETHSHVRVSVTRVLTSCCSDFLSLLWSETSKHYMSLYLCVEWFIWYIISLKASERHRLVWFNIAWGYSLLAILTHNSQVKALRWPIFTEDLTLVESAVVGSEGSNRQRAVCIQLELFW